ncbi:hypothetical protein IG631_15901 [Alternaria alternata]|nr:hypothetical protein IG631_15901 [Alternaria alternata]
MSVGSSEIGEYSHGCKLTETSSERAAAEAQANGEISPLVASGHLHTHKARCASIKRCALNRLLKLTIGLLIPTIIGSSVRLSLLLGRMQDEEVMSWITLLYRRLLHDRRMLLRPSCAAQEACSCACCGPQTFSPQSHQCFLDRRAGTCREGAIRTPCALHGNCLISSAFNHTSCDFPRRSLVNLPRDSSGSSSNTQEPRPLPYQ